MNYGFVRLGRISKLGSRVLFLNLCFIIAGCGLLKAGKACNLSAQGLQGEPLTGARLPNLSLSLVFLRGPTEVTADIGTFLEQRGTKAAFFVKGSAVPEHRDVLNNLREQGHLIGNGGYTFSPLLKSSEPALELRKTDALISPFISGDMFLMHAPDGEFDAALAGILNRQGLGKYLGPIQPDNVASESFMDDATCWSNDLSVSSCAQQYFVELTRLGKGIIGLHDEDSRSLELLNILLPQLEAFGFQLVRLDQIPDLRAALIAGGSSVDQLAGDSSCNDYE